MTEYPAMTIISGCPGTGKTSLVRALAQSWEEDGAQTLCVNADVFHTFPASPLSPELPEAREQNIAIAAAVAASAISFAESGYKVIIDGVVGPWMLPEFLKVFKGRLLGLSYVVLRAPLEETLVRASQRPDGSKFSPEGVKVMHQKFADLKMFEPHAFETDGKSLEETHKAIAPKIAERQFQFEIG